MFEAIVFDFGDTLFLFDRWNYDNCLLRMLDSLKRSKFSLEAPYEEFRRVYFEVRKLMYREAERSLREVDFCVRLAKTLKSFGLDLSHMDPPIVKAADAFFDAFVEDMRIEDHVPPLLKALRRDYKLGIITNFPYARGVINTLARFNLTSLFDAVVISGELGIRKPSPRIFEEALKILKVRASETVFVGDTLKTDIYGAQNAGMKAILVQSATARGREFAVPSDLDQMTVQPDRTIPDLKDLPATLKALASPDNHQPEKEMM